MVSSSESGFSDEEDASHSQDLPRTIGMHDETSDDSQDEETSSDGASDKDSTEEELEKLVFGDSAGFREGIQNFRDEAGAQYGLDTEKEADDGDNALATVDDADLFFLDDQPAHGAGDALDLVPDALDLDHAQSKPPAWEDSDDDRMRVSLMAVPRLRKLRRFEGEDVISGREYQQRLRRQYEMLHPAPAWAQWKDTEQQKKKKRRRSSIGAGSSDEEGEDQPEDMDTDGDEDEELSAKPLAKLLRSSQDFTRASQRLPNKRIKLKPETIAIERMKDIAPTQPHAITSISIHPCMPLLLSSGLSSTMYLHHLYPHPTPPDPPNPQITSLHLKHTPLTTTAFSPLPTSDTEPKIYLSSARRYFHTWTLPTGAIDKVTRVYGEQKETQRAFTVLKPSPCGRYIALLGTVRKGGGVVNILDASTSQWVTQARADGRRGLADFCWWGDGQGLTLLNKGGEATEWSMATRSVVSRWQDEGAVGSTTLAMGGVAANPPKKSKKSSAAWLGPDRWVAVGSTSGIVNIYDRSQWSAGPPANPTPTKTLANLTTPVSHLAISPCGQLLSMSSRWKRDALRLVHLPSCTVYRNWPTSKTPLGRISAVALGEIEVQGARDEFEKVTVLCVGNEQGHLKGWEVRG